LPGISAQWNQWSAAMWKDMALHLCIVDLTAPAAQQTKQYSVRYWGLKKYNEGWVGLYPSTYEIEKTTGEDGSTTKVKIVDLEQLAGIPKLAKAEPFWFAGRCYNKIQFAKRDKNNDFGWRCYGEDKKNCEGLYVRKGKQGYVIINYAMNTHQTRQNYGSGPAIWNLFHKYVEDMFFKDSEENYGGFMDEYEEAEDEWPN